MHAMTFDDVRSFVAELDRHEKAEAEAEGQRAEMWAEFAVKLTSVIAGVRVG